jgi:type III secretion system FlhB-like substrate exporter
MPRSWVDLAQRALSILGARGAGLPGSSLPFTSAPFSLEDLAHRALSILNEIGAGQAGAPEDLELARRETPGLLQRIYTRDLTPTRLETAIPADLFGPVATLLANAIADDFAVNDATANRIAQRVQVAEAELKALRLGRSQPRVMAEIPGLMQSLFERQVTEFEVGDPIPDALFSPIAVCLANLVADDFGADAETVSKVAARAQAAESEMRLIRRGRPTYRVQCSEFF